MKEFDPTLYFITDSTGWPEEVFLWRVEQALQGGATLMQLREKDKSTREYIALAEDDDQTIEAYSDPIRS